MINCEEIVKKKKEELKIRMPKNPAGLAIIQIGDNPASNSYIKGKINDCNEVGIPVNHLKFSQSISQDTVIDSIMKLNLDYSIGGIIVQLPLPRGFNEDKILKAIDPRKDIDGFCKGTKCEPCTPKGIYTILKEIGLNVKGKHAVVIGRGKTVGKPLAEMLTRDNATVTVCNSHTENLKKITLSADLLVVAAGIPNLITRDMVNDNTIIIDVGINRDEDGKLCGDVSRDCYDLEYITPVPKGVGLLTRISLLENLVMLQNYA